MLSISYVIDHVHISDILSLLLLLLLLQLYVLHELFSFKTCKIVPFHLRLNYIIHVYVFFSLANHKYLLYQKL